MSERRGGWGVDTQRWLRNGPLPSSPPSLSVVAVGGAKNSVLKLMAAALLAEGTTTISNCPDILDVPLMAEVLRGLGATVELDRDVVHVLRDLGQDLEALLRRERGRLRDVAREREHDLVEDSAAPLDQICFSGMKTFSPPPQYSASWMSRAMSLIFACGAASIDTRPSPNHPRIGGE